MAVQKEKDTCELHALTKLAESCKAAPRFGKNGRELLLAAVDSIDDDYEFQQSPPPKQKPHAGKRPEVKLQRSHASVKPPCTAKELFEAIPPLERPYVQYKIAQKVPRITRQSEVNKLAGKYLCLLLEKMDLTSSAHWISEVKGNESLRATAVQAADKHERSIYAETYSETNYKRTIRAVKALEGYVDVYWWKEKVPTRLDSVNSTQERLLILSPAQDESAQQVTGEAQGPKTDQWKEKDENSIEKCSPSGESTRSSARAGHASLKTNTQHSGVNRQHRQPTLESAKEQGPPPKDRRTAGTYPVLSEKDQRVLAFIKNILDPYFQAKVINRETYKSIVQKVHSKVLKVHEKDANADFLREEGMKVRHLIEKYIQHYTKAQT